MDHDLQDLIPSAIMVRLSFLGGDARQETGL